MKKGDGGDGWVTPKIKKASPRKTLVHKGCQKKGDGVTAVCLTYARVKKTLYIYIFSRALVVHLGVTPSPFNVFFFIFGELRGDGQKKSAVTSRHLLAKKPIIFLSNQTFKGVRSAVTFDNDCPLEVLS